MVAMLTPCSPSNVPIRPRVDANDSWSNPEKCAAYRYILPFGTGGELEHVGVITGRAQPCLGNFQAQTLGERRCVNFIHFVSAGALQETFQYRARYRSCIDFVYFPAVVDVEKIDPARGELRMEVAKFLAKTQMWT